MSRNLVGSIYGMSSIKNAHFVLICLQTWPPQAILVSGWLISKKSFPLKLSSQMNRNLVGSTYGRFCLKFPQNRMRDQRHRLSPLSLQFGIKYLLRMKSSMLHDLFLSSVIVNVDTYCHLLQIYHCTHNTIFCRFYHCTHNSIFCTTLYT